MTPSIPFALAGSHAARDASDELSDADLEQVVGGLARVWHAEAQVIAEPTPAFLSVTSIVSIEAQQLMSA